MVECQLLALAAFIELAATTLATAAATTVSPTLVVQLNPAALALWPECQHAC